LISSGKASPTEQGKLERNEMNSELALGAGCSLISSSKVSTERGKLERNEINSELALGAGCSFISFSKVSTQGAKMSGGLNGQMHNLLCRPFHRGKAGALATDSLMDLPSRVHWIRAECRELLMKIKIIGDFFVLSVTVPL
jgi:hypothetical protein